MSKVTIYHNPKCATSRNALAIIREAGIEPEVVEYLKTPLDTDGLNALLAQLAIPARELVRTKGGLYKELGLDNPDLSDEALVNAVAENPVLMERPIVITAKGARVCRPYGLVEALL